MSSYLGMHAGSGQALSDDDHIRQSVADILTTPVGSMITLREYGSYNLQLIDQPVSPALRLQIMASSVMALMRWEPRVTPASIHITQGNAASAWSISLVLTRTQGPQAGSRLNIAIPIGRRQS